MSTCVNCGGSACASAMCGGCEETIQRHYAEEEAANNAWERQMAEAVERGENPWPSEAAAK